MCADVRPMLPDWVADHLDPAARRAVDTHLSHCAACRAEADGWTALADAADAYVAAAGPPPAWRSPLAADGERSEAIAPPARLGRWRSSSWVAYAALAAAVVLLALGGGRRLYVVLRGDPGLVANAPSGAPSDSPHVASSSASTPTVVVRAPTPVVRRSAESAGPSLNGAPAVGAPPGERPSGIRADAATPAIAPPRRASPYDAREGTSTAILPPPTPVVGSDAPPATAPASASPPREHRPTAPSASPPASPPPGTPAVSPPPVSTPPVNPSPVPPSPVPPPPGSAIVTGIVTGPDGFERAEVNLVALPVDPAEAPRTTTTGAAGTFTLTLPAGRWSIHAEAPAYLPAWPDGARTPLDSAPVDVAAGQTARVRFMLAAASFGAIRGRVVDAAGAPAAGALVVAAAPDRERGGYTSFVAAAFADADGRYALAVDEGAWLVAAAIDWRTPALSWWGGDGDLVAVDWVAVSRERAADGIDIRLRDGDGR